jgi:hypothetical protein
MAAVVYSTGFENPPFTVGNLAGQDAWDRADEGSATPSITVQTGTVKTGSQAVGFTNSQATNGESSFAYRDFTTINPVTAGTPLIEINWDMLVTSGGSFAHAWQIQAYDDATSLNLVAGAGLGKDSGGGSHVSGSDAAGTGNIDFGPGPTLGDWHNYTLTLDYALNLYAIDIDGTRRAIGAFAAGNGGTFGEIDLVSNNRDLDSAFFDNLSINATTGTIPEPASLGLIGVAGAMLLGRRRRTA